MLLNLHVKNMALIREIDVDFKDGLNVFTGETGAGKSLILGSLNIALGQKASKDIIREDAEYALVELTFSMNEKSREKLVDNDITVDEDCIVVSRKIMRNRSVAKVNGETVNVSVLKDIMSDLVDIHGQHEHQSLLYKENYIKILDEYSKKDLGNLLEELKKEYSEYTKLKAQLEELDIDDKKRARDIEFLKFEVNEIENANLEANEDVLIEEEFKKISENSSLADTLSNIEMCLGFSDNSSAGNSVANAISAINNIHSDNQDVENIKNSIYDLEDLLRTTLSDIERLKSGISLDRERENLLESRLDEINKLKIKYGQSIEEINDYLENQKKELDLLLNFEENKEKLKSEILNLEKKLHEKALKISSIRKNNAEILQKLVEDALKDLNFMAVKFTIKIGEKENISAEGIDDIEFLVSTNVGMEPKPLRNVASGGELSRIMLALKSILAGNDDIDTLIFDEIDTGISGITALKVAEKMSLISRNHQVICISHLSQIAAMADSHYLIEKKADDNSTITSIKLLSYDERVDELVRINSGFNKTDAAINQAKEMLESARNSKK